MLTFKKHRLVAEPISKVSQNEHVLNVNTLLASIWPLSKKNDIQKIIFFKMVCYKTMFELGSARSVSSRGLARSGVNKQMDLGIYLFPTGGPRSDRTGRHKSNQSSQMCQGSLFLPHSCDLTVNSHTLKRIIN